MSAGPCRLWSKRMRGSLGAGGQTGAGVSAVTTRDEGVAQETSRLAARPASIIFHVDCAFMLEIASHAYEKVVALARLGCERLIIALITRVKFQLADRPIQIDAGGKHILVITAAALLLKAGLRVHTQGAGRMPVIV